MTPPARIYLDHHGTTPVDPRVLEAMLPFLEGRFGNPSARHHVFGRDAEEAVDGARATLARCLGAEPAEIVFTSGATESNNLALFGAARALAGRGRHLVTCAVEHKAVLLPMERLASEGWECTVLAVDRHGRVDPAAVAAALRPDTVLVSIMHANNEVGTLQPVAEIGALCRERDVFLHSDAAQTVGKEPVDVDALQVDYLSLSSHKIYGPKGSGALFVRRRGRQAPLEPLFQGAGHERGLRSGTLNVPGIVGLARAVEIALAGRETEHARIAALRDRLQERLAAGVPDLQVNGHPRQRLAGNLNVTFRFARADDLLAALPEIAVSTGSSCSSADPAPSHVLKAIGLSDEDARCTIRFGLGRSNTKNEIDAAASRFAAAVAALRERSPLYRMQKEAPPPESSPTRSFRP